MAHQQQREEHREEGEGVQHVHQPDVERADEHPRERGPAHAAQLAQEMVQAHRVREVLARHEPRQERLLRGRLERRRRGHRRREPVEREHAHAAGEGENGEQPREERGRRLRPDDQPAPVVHVREHAAEEAEHHHGQHAHQPERAQPERFRVQLPLLPQQRERVRLVPEQPVDVPVHGDELHLVAGDREELAEPQQPEVPVAQRGEARGARSIHFRHQGTRPGDASSGRKSSRR